MTTNPNDPAFPSPEDRAVNAEDGVSKREYFAAMALQSALLDPNVCNSAQHSLGLRLPLAAQMAVKAADALIEALNQPPT